MQDTSDALAFGNSQIAIAGDMGSIYIGSDHDPVDAIDDITPTAYEEANGSGGGSGYVDVTGHAGNMGIGFKSANLVGTGMDINAKYYPKVDGAKNADNSVSGDANADATDGMSVTLRGNPGNFIDGLGISLGFAETENVNKNAGKGQDNLDMTAAINYATGPVKVGVQRSYAQVQNSDNTYDSEIFGIAYAINESLSVSFNHIKQTLDYGDTHGAAEDQAQTAQAINAAYSVGGAVISIQTVDVDDAGFVAAKDDTGTTIGLSVAF